MHFHTETGSGAASDFWKGQCSQCCDFVNKLGSLVTLELPHTHTPFTKAPVLQNSTLPLPDVRQAEPMLAAGVWSASFVLLPSLLGRSPRSLLATCSCHTPHAVSELIVVTRRREGERLAMWLAQEKATFCSWGPLWWLFGWECGQIVEEREERGSREERET